MNAPHTAENKVAPHSQSNVECNRSVGLIQKSINQNWYSNSSSFIVSTSLEIEIELKWMVHWGEARPGMHTCGIIEYGLRVDEKESNRSIIHIRVCNWPKRFHAELLRLPAQSTPKPSRVTHARLSFYLSVCWWRVFLLAVWARV